MRSVQHSSELATTTPLVEMLRKKPFTILNAYMYTPFSYSFNFDAENDVLCYHTFSN